MTETTDNTDDITENRRLRQLIREIAQCRQDATVVHEIAQQALGYDPDLEDHENVA